MGSGSATTSSDVAGALDARWRDLRARGRVALIPYITAGHPDAAATRAFLQGAAAAGADMVELGVPWSDPVADGPVIQASSHVALAAGMTLPGVLRLLAESKPALPVVLMTYLNPVLRYGPARFAAAAAAAGAAGVLVTDLPAGGDAGVEAALTAGGLPLVRLVAPTTTPARLAGIAAAAGSHGFVYLVGRLGVTGSGHLADTLGDSVAALRRATRLPVAVGFGVSDAATAQRVGRLADGVVVGSAVVARLAERGADGALALVRELRAALDAARTAA